MEEIVKTINEICEDEIIKVVISNKKNKEIKYNKVVFQLKEKKGEEYYQIEKFTDKQVFHENIELNDLNEKILEFMKEDFKQLDAWSKEATYNMKVSKKGKVFLGKKKVIIIRWLIKAIIKKKIIFLKKVC